ncbi:hypothetical protein [Streptomyces sp. NPDC056672]|uniref:hypothetical protein n=1 Tax=Streptomyces sp. NPDC056672 TaxID=3345906 RepID=UPI00367D4807
MAEKLLVPYRAALHHCPGTFRLDVRVRGEALPQERGWGLRTEYAQARDPLGFIAPRPRRAAGIAVAPHGLR